MSVDRFQKTGSGILVSVLIGLIVVSFMFSDYQSFTNKVGSSGTIAKVGSSSVKVEEFRNEYNRQIQLYQQMFGKELSQQDIDGLNLKNNALESVINNKLLTNLASEVGISAGADEVKQEIKEISYFKTDENFDIEKYKFILSRNRLTPNEFEENILTDLKTKKLQSIIKTFPISSKYMEQINTFKGQKIKATMAKITLQEMFKFVEVSKDEMDSFLKNDANLARVTSKFNEQKKQLDQPEQIKARHILLTTEGKDEEKVKAEIEDLAKKVTLKNFKEMANKFTEDPSGKTNGGDLDWFAKGRMVPAFEEVAFNMDAKTISSPVKSDFGYHIIMVEDKKAAKEAIFEDYKMQFTKEMIQNSKNDDAKALLEKVKVEVKAAMDKKEITKLEALEKKYGFLFEKEKEINRLDGTSGQLSLSDEQLRTLFEKSKTNASKEVQIFDEIAGSIIVQAAPFVGEEKNDNDNEQDKKVLSQAISNKLFQSVLTQLKNTTTIKRY